MSRHDLPTGGRWSYELAGELENAQFGLICLTPENRSNPWLLFEAGALTKHLTGRACCVLLRELKPTDVTGPLAQFQNAHFTESDVRKLLGDMNALQERPLDSDNLELIFAKWWPDLQRDVSAALADPNIEQPSLIRRSPEELLEELLLRVRSLDQRLDSSAQDWQSAVLPIQHILTSLPRDQTAVLGSLITYRGSSIPAEREALQQDHDGAAIDALLELGIITTVDDGRLAVREALIPVISQHFRVNPESSYRG